MCRRRTSSLPFSTPASLLPPFSLYSLEDDSLSLRRFKFWPPFALCSLFFLSLFFPLILCLGTSLSRLRALRPCLHNGGVLWKRIRRGKGVRAWVGSILCARAAVPAGMHFPPRPCQMERGSRLCLGSGSRFFLSRAHRPSPRPRSSRPTGRIDVGAEGKGEERRRVGILHGVCCAESSRRAAVTAATVARGRAGALPLMSFRALLLVGGGPGLFVCCFPIRRFCVRVHVRRRRVPDATRTLAPRKKNKEGREEAGDGWRKEWDFGFLLTLTTHFGAVQQKRPSSNLQCSQSWNSILLCSEE